MMHRNMKAQRGQDAQGNGRMRRITDSHRRCPICDAIKSGQANLPRRQSVPTEPDRRAASPAVVYSAPILRFLYFIPSHAKVVTYYDDKTHHTAASFHQTALRARAPSARLASKLLPKWHNAAPKPAHVKKMSSRVLNAAVFPSSCRAIDPDLLPDGQPGSL